MSILRVAIGVILGWILYRLGRVSMARDFASGRAIRLTLPRSGRVSLTTHRGVVVDYDISIEVGGEFNVAHFENEA